MTLASSYPACVRVSLLPFVLVLGAMTLAVRPAAAQTTTLNQTTCVPDPTNLTSCLAGGALQTLTVACSSGGKINSALAAIQDRNGPNIINVSGTCSGQSVSVIGFNRLTIQGPATINLNAVGALVINSSRGILLKDLTLTGGGGLSLQDAQVTGNGLSVQGAVGVGIALNQGSNMNLGGLPTGNPSSVTGSGGDGINVNTGSSLNVGNTTISGNGIGPNGGAGIRTHDGGVTTLNATNGPIDISANDGEGVLADVNGGLIASAPAGLNAIHIHDNGRGGIEGIASLLDLKGNILIDNNGGAGIQVSLGSQAGIASGVQVLANGSGGVVVDFQSQAIFGDEDPLSVGATVSSGVTIAYGSAAFSFGPNAISAVSCDTTSWVVGDFGTGSTCPIGGPSGSTGPQGPVGPAGAAGAAGVAGPAGPDGTPGSAGPTGPQGATGAAGAAGPQGVAGPSGPTGPQGTAGLTGATGPQGVAGPVGATGPRGLVGASGPQGAPGISALQNLPQTANPTMAGGTQTNVTAACPAGKSLLGGGGVSTNTNIVMVGSFPVAAGWRVRFRNTAANNQTATLTVTAICAVVN